MFSMDKSFDFGAVLKNNAKKHKNRPSHFMSVSDGVLKRLENNLKYRKSNRLTEFDSKRDLSKCESPAPAPLSEAQLKTEHRRLQLEKWKAEKEKKKKEAAALKKKPFVAGVAHAPLKFVPPPPPPKPTPSTSGRVTRSQAIRNTHQQKQDAKPIAKSVTANNTQSFAPRNASFRPPQLNNLIRLPKLDNWSRNKKSKGVNKEITFDPVIPNAVQPLSNMKQTRSRTNANKSSAQETKANNKQKNTKTNKVTNAKQYVKNNKLSSKTVVLKCDSAENIRKRRASKKLSPTMDSLKLQNSSSSDLEQPITEENPGLQMKTLGKSQQNKTGRISLKNPSPKSESNVEEKLRSPKPIVDEPSTPVRVAEEFRKISPNVTMSRGKDNIRKEMKKKLDEGLFDEEVTDMSEVNHFRRQLHSEMERITEMCAAWDKTLEQTQLPDTVQELVFGAVGQARLLMAQKMQQFALLVEQCARPVTGTALVTPADLHGFWDVVFIQVENVDMRFKKLEELRARGWSEEQIINQPKKVVTKPAVKKVTKPTAGPSRLREMIAAARKARKEQETQLSVPATVDILPNADDNKTFNAGFFCVRSPVRSPAATPNRNPSLLKSVLSSEAKKASAAKNSASFAMLRASVMSKSVEMEGVAPLHTTPKPLTPINLLATPSRSILKSVNNTESDKSAKKSIRHVLFNESNADLQNSFTDEITVPEKELSGDTVNEDQNIENVKLNSNMNVDSGVSSAEENIEKNKENPRRRSRLTRQHAFEEWSPIMTRSKRKSIQNTPKADPSPNKTRTPRRSTRNKMALQELKPNIIE